jgi:hypothetical protein
MLSLTRTRRRLTHPEWPISSRVADNYKPRFIFLLSRAWRRLTLRGGRTENPLFGRGLGLGPAPQCPWHGRPLTPLDMILIRGILPGLPGDAFLAEAKQLRKSARMGSWSLHRRGERRTPSRTPRSCRRAGVRCRCRPSPRWELQRCRRRPWCWPKAAAASELLTAPSTRLHHCCPLH